jgi:SAM-dependent methyltransferase
MNRQEREVVCKQLMAEKRLLGLPIDDVSRIDGYLRSQWGISPPVAPHDWDKVFAQIAGPNLYQRFKYLHDKQASFLKRKMAIPSEISRRFYDLVADERISGFIHSQKRSYILDTAVLLISLISHLKVTNRILDIGCHIGYHPILLALETGCGLHGIDRSEVAIEFAKRKSPAGLDISFMAGSFPGDLPSESFELVFAIDSVLPTAENITKLASLLQSDGVLILVGDYYEFDNLAFRQALGKADLGFGLADIVGGWIGEERGYNSASAFLLIKGSANQLPEDFENQVTAGWDFFRNYANAEGTDWDRKTQAYCRSQFIKHNKSNSQ